MESINISFSANGQQLTGGGLYCASNTVHYIIADFELGDGWQGFDSVRAVWSNDFKCISTVLDPDGSCTVPHEVLERRGKVSVNLLGSILEDGELTDRLTTYPVLAITVDANAKICGTETAEITPSQFEQFVQIVKDEVAKVKDIDRAELNADYTLTFYFSDGTETTVGPIRGEQGETGNGIESAVLNDDYTLTLTFTDGTEYTTPSIRGEQGEQGEPGEVTLAQLSAVLPTDTASGAIASFPDGIDLFDYLSCIVDIDPLQDLHGYDKPWVGGSHYNQWDEDWELGYISASTGGNSSSTTEIRSKNYIPVSPSTTYYAYTGNQTGTQRMAFYDSSKTYIGNGPGGWAVLPSNGTFTTPADAYYMRFYVQGNTYGNNIAINYPSSVTTYSPWENLCPITGWTGCEVDVAGVNLWDEETESGYIRPSTGETVADASKIRMKNYMPVLPNTTYYKKTPVGFWCVYFDADKNYIGYGDSGANTTFTTPPNCYFIRSGFESSYGTTYNHDISINYPSTDHEYHAHNPNSAVYPASWQTEAGTVYGGTVDVVSGVLTVDRASVDLGTLTWTYEGTRGIFEAKPTTTAKNLFSALCSIYPFVGSYSLLVDKSCAYIYGNYIAVKDSTYGTDATAFKSAMNGVQLVYELAQAQTYQLDPVQVACLLGQNNVWADCGDIEEVKYKADMQLWVEKKLGE